MSAAPMTPERGRNLPDPILRRRTGITAATPSHTYLSLHIKDILSHAQGDVLIDDVLADVTPRPTVEQLLNAYDAIIATGELAIIESFRFKRYSAKTERYLRLVAASTLEAPE